MRAAKINGNWRVINGIKKGKAISIAQNNHIPMQAFTKEQLLKGHQNLETTEFIKVTANSHSVKHVSSDWKQSSSLFIYYYYAETAVGQLLVMEHATRLRSRHDNAVALCVHIDGFCCSVCRSYQVAMTFRPFAFGSYLNVSLHCKDWVN